MQDELMKIYQNLPETEREALNETIMDQGVTDFDSLLKAFEMVKTYLQEQ
jgi:2-hydroxy-3-keto-5-methylthiopentenyl-1-phosphate phosphatase